MNTPVPAVTQASVSNPQQLLKVIRDLQQQLNNSNSQIATLQSQISNPTLGINSSSLSLIQSNLEANGSYPLNLKGLPGINLSYPSQPATIPYLSSLPPIANVADQSVVIVSNVVYQFHAGNPGAWIAVGSTGGGGGGVVSQGAYSSRPAPSSQPAGAIYVATDLGLTFVNNSSQTAWIYVSGIYQAVAASIASLILQSWDIGALAFSTDYAHLHEWNGTSWGWGPGDLGSGYVQDFINNPPSMGGTFAWQLCNSNGNSPIPISTANANTILVTVPNHATYLVNGIPGAVVRGGSIYTGVVDSSTQQATSAPNNTVNIPQGTGANIQAATWDHIHADGATFPPFIVLIPFLRR